MNPACLAYARFLKNGTLTRSVATITSHTVTGGGHYVRVEQTPRGRTPGGLRAPDRNLSRPRGAGIDQRVEDSHHPLDGRELHRPAGVDLHLDVRPGPRAGEERISLAGALRAGAAADLDAVHSVSTKEVEAVGSDRACRTGASYH